MQALTHSYAGGKTLHIFGRCARIGRYKLAVFILAFGYFLKIIVNGSTASLDLAAQMCFQERQNREERIFVFALYLLNEIHTNNNNFFRFFRLNNFTYSGRRRYIWMNSFCRYRTRQQKVFVFEKRTIFRYTSDDVLYAARSVISQILGYNTHFWWRWI